NGNGHASNGHHPLDDRSIIPGRIEDLLPGGVIHGPHGAAFVHERLYTDLGEQPELVLARYDALCALEPDPEPEPAVVSADAARPYDPALEPRVVYDPEWQPATAPLDLPRSSRAWSGQSVGSSAASASARCSSSISRPAGSRRARSS